VKAKYLAVLVLCFLLGACGKKNSTAPEAPIDVGEFVQSTVQLTPQAWGIVDAAIDEAVRRGTGINPDTIATSIRKLAMVASAEPTESGSAIIVKHKESHYSTILLNLRDDDRLFLPASAIRQTVEPSPPQSSLARPTLPAEHPTGNRVLILLPFQFSLKEDPARISAPFIAAGFTVTVYANEEVTLERCRGDFLAGFHAIYFSTHGIGRGRTLGGRHSTILSTREPVTEASLASLSDDEINALAVTIIHNKAYWGISIPWLEETLSIPFPGSWFYANACESAREDNGSASFSAYLLTHGVGGFSGYDASINYLMTAEIDPLLVSWLLSGKSLADATHLVHTDLGLLAHSWLLRNVYSAQKVDAELLDSSQRLTEPYYLLATGADFPYNTCIIDFFCRATYHHSTKGENSFAFGRLVEVKGKVLNGVFNGNALYKDEFKEESKTAEIQIDLVKHQITRFKITGYSKDIISTNWSISGTSVPLPGNSTNSYFYVKGTDFGKYVGKVEYFSSWKEPDGLTVSEDLVRLNVDADSQISFQFSNR